MGSACIDQNGKKHVGNQQYSKYAYKAATIKIEKCSFFQKIRQVLKNDFACTRKRTRKRTRIIWYHSQHIVPRPSAEISAGCAPSVEMSAHFKF